ncbi:hypothetical protein ANANG_G00172490 [Anguilla anguilla]|uniref:Cadherin domain-containing protein n=1 Tax=Anguilla anguilla TaxID=7936 RepID=A0A9D3RT56_ANGAN|nr:hypothetical protein ANANG_G00172490 [Anguilla anguilla]
MPQSFQTAHLSPQCPKCRISAPQCSRSRPRTRTTQPTGTVPGWCTASCRGSPTSPSTQKPGVIRTALGNMDREAREQYAVVIQAKDMAGQVGGLSGSTTVNVTLTDVNDNPPKFPQKNYQLYVPESAQVGKAVGKIKANDEDLGVNAEITYSITNAEGAAIFSITTDRDKREGVISLKKPLNFEKKKAYTLHIEGANTHLDPRFSHLGPFKDHTTLKIIVGDVDEAPVFSMDYYIMDVYENAEIGTEVGAVTARDPDSTNSPVRGISLIAAYTEIPISTSTQPRESSLPLGAWTGRRQPGITSRSSPRRLTIQVSSVMSLSQSRS